MDRDAETQQNNILREQNDALAAKLAEAEAELERQMERQQRLGDITDNYLMLHYLNKNIQDCRTSQKVWETYLHNIGERDFAMRMLWSCCRISAANFRSNCASMQNRKR